MTHIATPDGVPLAIHDLAGHEPAPIVLIVHANGFHGRAYRPLAEALAHRLHSVAVDLRGHGATPTPAAWCGDDAPRVIEWEVFGDDVLHVARKLSEQSPDGQVIGFGHSLGGAALLMAAERDPEPFRRLVLFEPVVPPPHDEPVDTETLSLVIAARRRRRRFDSYDAAFDNFAAKRPLSSMTRDALHEYVDHGFAEVTDGTGGVELRCHPDVEAGIFAGSLTNGVWDRLPSVAVPVRVIAGHVIAGTAAESAEPAAARIPGAEFVTLPHLSHFGPFESPADVADLVPDPG